MQILIQPTFAEPKHPSELEDEPLVVHRRPEAADNQGLILFVHGLGGSRYGDGATWGHFPAFLYEDVPQADVGMYEYRTLFKRYRLWESIELQDEAEVLAGIIRDIENYRTIVLMGHSMGGLLAMSAIAHLLTTNQRNALSCIGGLFLMATPQTGSQRVPRLLSIFSKDFRVLAPHSKFVTNVNQVFWDHVSLGDETSSPDKLVIPTWAVVGASDFWVGKLSAGLRLPSERKRTVRSSHVEVVKPRTKDADVYQFVKRHLLNVFEPSGPADKLPFVPFRRPDLIGREDYVERLHAVLQDPGAPAVAVTGRGGIGKTQLAVLYAHDKERAWPGGIFWLDAAREARPAAQQLGDYAVLMKLPAPSAEGDVQELSRLRALVWCGQVGTRSDVLLIADNVQDPSFVTGDLAGLPGKSLAALGCHALVTTRLPELPGCTDFSVELLTPEQAKEVLLKDLKVPEGAEEAPAIKQIIALVGGLPLALRLVNGLLKSYSADRLAAGLKNAGAIELLDKEGKPIADYRKGEKISLQALFAETWDALPADRPALKDILRTLGVLPQTERIRVKLLRQLIEVPADPYGLEDDPFASALTDLERRNLAERPDDPHVRLHPLVQEYARTQATRAFAEDLIVRAATRLRSADYLARADADELLTLLRELPMLESIADERR